MVLSRCVHFSLGLMDHWSVLLIHFPLDCSMAYHFDTTMDHEVAKELQGVEWQMEVWSVIVGPGGGLWWWWNSV